MIERVAHYPQQKLPMSQKNDDWKRACVDFFIGSSYVGRYNGKTTSERMQINYELYNSRFNRKDLEYVTNPFNIDEDSSFPANLQNFNIIRPKIDLLVGEEIKRPFNWRVIQTNPEATSRIERQKKGMLLQYVLGELQKEMGPPPQQQGQEGEQGQQEAPPTPPEIEKYMRYSYKDIYESAAYKSLSYLYKKLDLETTFVRGFKDALISGMEIYYTGNKCDDPYIERCNPIFIDFDKDPELYHIEKGEWATRKIRMTPSAAYDRFKDILSEEDFEELLKGQYSVSTNANDVNYRFIRKEFQGDSFENLAANLINVFHTVWRSYKKVGYLKYVDEFGVEQETVVDEKYKASPEDDIEWDWIIEIWEGYRFGQNIYAGIKPTDYTELPYIGTIYSRTNSNNVSLVDLMKPIQYMYIIIWYRLELTIARDKGKVITMDVTQIPKSLGLDFSKWAHYLSAMGINFVNPYEEGIADVSRGGHPSSFNQFAALDLSTAQVIQEYIYLLEKLETMIGELSGVSRQREGSINNSELVGNVERAVSQSSLVTEQLFWQHSKCKERVLQSILNTAKHLWEGKDKKLQFVLDDMAREIMTLPDDFSAQDYDIFVSNSSKDNKIIESLRSLAQPALQAGASLYDVAVMYMTEDVADMKNKLKELDERKQQLLQQQQQAEMQQEQQKLQTEMSKFQAEIEQKEKDSIRKSNTAIEVAMIGSQNKEGEFIDESPEDNNINQRKLDIQKEKQDKEDIFKHRQLDNEMKKHRDEMNIKAKELKIKEKQANKKPPTRK